jgi:hypothetical protein
LKAGGTVADGLKCDAVTGANLATDVACKLVKKTATPSAEACDYTAAADTTD